MHVAELSPDAKIIELCSRDNFCSFEHVLDVLQFNKPNGLTVDEALKILWYMHHRETGKNRGGEFLYKVYDAYGDLVTDADIPFSVRSPYTKIKHYLEDFEDEGGEDDEDADDEDYIPLSQRLIADAYIFADAPHFGIVAARLGFDVVSYQDAFVSGERAAEVLLGCEDVYDLDGIDEEEDLDDDNIPTHMTFRPLHEGAIQVIESIPTAELLPQVACADPDLKSMKKRLMR